MSPYLSKLRAKIGHDLLTLTAAAIVTFDKAGRLLLAEDAETGLWTLPGGAVDPDELPSDAAVRECWEETGLLVEPNKLIGVFGGPEFRVTYPHGDLVYYTTIAFEARIIGGSPQPDGSEITKLEYFRKVDINSGLLSSSTRVIAKRAFMHDNVSYFKPTTWSPPPR